MHCSEPACNLQVLRATARYQHKCLLVAYDLSPGGLLQNDMNTSYLEADKKANAASADSEANINELFEAWRSLQQ